MLFSTDNSTTFDDLLGHVLLPLYATWLYVPLSSMKYIDLQWESFVNTLGLTIYIQNRMNYCYVVESLLGEKKVELAL